MTPEISPVAQLAKAHELLAEARGLYDDILRFERVMIRDRDLLLSCAWDLGKLLAAMKDTVGHGKWLFWLGANWPEIGERNARRCMVFFRDNFKSAESADLKRIEEIGADVLFSAESVRKFMWGYIPAKERAELDGDQPITRGAHHLSVVNGFAKFDRQLKLGHITASTEDMRRDFAPIIPRLVELLGRQWIQSLLEG